MGLGGKRLKQKSDKFMEEDWISCLPDEILISILSHLTLKEAAKTSVLSRRWENLWAFTTCLNFDSSELISEILVGRKLLLYQARTKYISWVNKVLDLHQGSGLDEFNIRFDFDKSFSCHLDKWIAFALPKRVKRFEIDLTMVGGHYLAPFGRYTFPKECYSFVKSPHGLSSIMSLRSLCLKFVNVTGELLEHFLSNCPLLERLYVGGTEHLLNLKVTGSSLRLKYLEISRCFCLKNVEISVPTLVSFSYFGQRIGLQVQNVPHLVDLSIGAYNVIITYAFAPFSSYFAQLQTLTLCMVLHEENLEFTQLPELSNVKHLILKVVPSFKDTLLGLTPLLKLSPSLHKFTLQLSGTRLVKKFIQSVKCPLRCLKVVEMVGFVGDVIDVELAMFFLENAIVLEKIVIDPRDPFLLGVPWKLDETKKKQVARNCACELKTKLWPGVELVIL